MSHSPGCAGKAVVKVQGKGQKENKGKDKIGNGTAEQGRLGW